MMQTILTLSGDKQLIQYLSNMLFSYDLNYRDRTLLPEVFKDMCPNQLSYEDLCSYMVSYAGYAPTSDGRIHLKVEGDASVMSDFAEALNAITGLHVDGEDVGEYVINSGDVERAMERVYVVQPVLVDISYTSPVVTQLQKLTLIARGITIEFIPSWQVTVPKDGCKVIQVLRLTPESQALAKILTDEYMSSGIESVEELVFVDNDGNVIPNIEVERIDILDNWHKKIIKIDPELAKATGGTLRNRFDNLAQEVLNGKWGISLHKESSKLCLYDYNTASRKMAIIDLCGDCTVKYLRAVYWEKEYETLPHSTALLHFVSQALRGTAHDEENGHAYGEAFEDFTYSYSLTKALRILVAHVKEVISNVG